MDESSHTVQKALKNTLSFIGIVVVALKSICDRIHLVDSSPIILMY